MARPERVPAGAQPLDASTTANDTVWFVKLFDMAPDGTSMPLSDGVLKASMREIDETQSRPGLPWHPYTQRRMPEAGTIYEYQIELRPIFHTFKPGHRLSVQIASNDPQFMNFLHTVYNTEMPPTLLARHQPGAPHAPACIAPAAAGDPRRTRNRTGDRALEGCGVADRRAGLLGQVC